MPLLVAPAMAQSHLAISPQIVFAGVLGTAGVALAACLAGFLAFKLRRALAAAHTRVGDLELLLNEAEASLLSEPQVLAIWRGDGAKPERLINNMRAAPPLCQRQPRAFSSFRSGWNAIPFQAWARPLPNFAPPDAPSTLESRRSTANFSKPTAVPRAVSPRSAFALW